MKTLVWFGLVLGALSAMGKVFVTKSGQSVRLECGGSKYKNSLVWHHGSDLIFNINGKTGFNRKGTVELVSRAKEKNSNLEISPVKEEDAGKYSCNADGNNQEHTLLVVSVSVVPTGDLQPGSEATLQCQVKGLNPQPTVQWKKLDRTLQTETAVLKPVARSDAGAWECMFSHESITYSEQLIIKIAEPAPTTPAPAPNSKDDPKTTCHNCATKPPTDAMLLGLSWWMWVLVGVGCLVVVLLIVFIICMCKRIKRKKRKFHKMKNSRQPLTPKQFCQCDRPTAAAKPQQGRRREKPSAPPLQPLLME